MGTLTNKRDLRIDLFRGLALVIIFIDHIPFDKLSSVTIRNLGLSSAADTFVLLAGIAVVLAYGSRFKSGGVSAIIGPIFRRVAQIYLAHILVLAIALVLLLLAGRNLPFDSFTSTPAPSWAGQDITNAIPEALTLQFQPPYFDILPMYVVLLLLAIPFFVLARIHCGVAMAVSLVIWLLTIACDINVPGTRSVEGWYFNPLSWQVVFVAGMCIGVRAESGAELKGHAVLTVACLAYLALAFVAVAPCRHAHLADYCYFDLLARLDVVEDRQTPLRFLNTLAWAYLVVRFIPRNASWLKSPISRWATRMGQHSLAVFCLGTLLSLMGRLLFTDYNAPWPMQISINVVGIMLLALAAYALERDIPALIWNGATARVLQWANPVGYRDPRRVR